MFEFIKENIWIIAVALNYILVISALATILFNRINPTKTLTYIIVLLVFPVIGLIVYYLFGREYRKSKIFNRKNILNNDLIKSITEDLNIESKDLQHSNSDLLDNKIKLIKLLQSNEMSPLTVYNNIEIIVNGENKFRMLFEDIDKAKHHIHLEYYILKDDTIGNALLDKLKNKALEGVSVRISYDDVGSKISKKTLKSLKEHGIECYPFMPVLFPKFTGKMNYRNHRKIIVIDGKIGYVGGINISDNYVNKSDRNKYWRDTHSRIEGEAVFSLQVQFLTNWNFVSGSSIKLDSSFFDFKRNKSNIPLQIAASGPDTDWANIMEAIFCAITSAEKYVYITSPYLIPNDEIITALQVASKSGVDVRLLIPNKSDSWTAKHATNSYIEQFLEANIKVYRYTKGFIHAKTLVVDDIFSTIGTSNLDYRSFNINFEINVLIYDKPKSKEIKAHFLEDLKDAELIDLQTWSQRKTSEKLKEAYCRLWAPLL